MNILLTSVGRRTYMVRYFQEALEGIGEVHVCNSDDTTVAFQYADRRVVSPLIYDTEYIPFLLRYCQMNKINVLLSLFDIDLLMLSKHKEEFEKIGTRVIVSNQEFVEICNDKWKTFQFLCENHIHAPKTYLTIESALEAIDIGELNYPVIVKPRFGCGSIGLSTADDETELILLFRRTLKEVKKSYLKYESVTEENKVIFQECLQGQEYGLDVINDLDGCFKNAIIKKKLAMRSGETDIAETVNSQTIFEIAHKIAVQSKHIGNLDMDVFLVGDVPYVLEMNARFGGGYPFSHNAGCNLPKAIVKWCKGETVDESLLQAKSGLRTYKELVLTSAKY